MFNFLKNHSLAPKVHYFNYDGSTSTLITEKVDVYINMIDSDNCYDMSDVSADKKILYQQYYFKPIYFKIIVPKLRWVTVDYPSVSSAQQFVVVK